MNVKIAPSRIHEIFVGEQAQKYIKNNKTRQEQHLSESDKHPTVVLEKTEVSSEHQKLYPPPPIPFRIVFVPSHGTNV